MSPDPTTPHRPADPPTLGTAGLSTHDPFAAWVGDGAAPASPPGFDLAEEVGRGGMGVVYRGRDRAIGRDVAVKVLHPGSGSMVGIAGVRL